MSHMLAGRTEDSHACINIRRSFRIQKIPWYSEQPGLVSWRIRNGEGLWLLERYCYAQGGNQRTRTIQSVMEMCLPWIVAIQLDLMRTLDTCR